jgi:CubicO group peptidase (beta-lactamase class C family)
MRFTQAILTLSFVSGLCFSHQSQAADPFPRAKPKEVGMSSERLAEIDKLIEADVARGQLPGAVIAIVRRGKLVYLKAFGYRDKTAGTPMTVDTIFYIASMTKPVAAVAGLTLYEHGKLLMNDPLAKYFPKFGQMQVAIMDDKQENIISKVPAARQITIQDLMRHTSGFVFGNRGGTAVHKLYPEQSISAAATMTGPEFLDRLSSLPLLHHPGTTWDYGFGLDVLGLVVEQVTEQTLGQYLEKRVFGPLGMVDTGFLVPAEKLARYAKALPNDPATGKPQSQSLAFAAAFPNVAPMTQPLKFECGGSCLTSTASDYMRFAQMLLNRGTLGGSHILARKTVEYMVSNQLGPEIRHQIGDADPSRADYGFGLGVAVRTTPGIVRLMGSVGDFSWAGASGTNWWADPREQLAVVFMAQTPGPIRWHYRQVINALVYQAIVD